MNLLPDKSPPSPSPARRRPFGLSSPRTSVELSLSLSLFLSLRCIRDARETSGGEERRADDFSARRSSREGTRVENTRGRYFQAHVVALAD